MEGNVDTRKQDCGEASLELDVALSFLLVLGLLEASGDNVIQHFLHLLDTVCFRQLPKKSISTNYWSFNNGTIYLSNINLLHLEII